MSSGVGVQIQTVPLLTISITGEVECEVDIQAVALVTAALTGEVEDGSIR